MSNISTFANQDNQTKIDQISLNGEIIHAQRIGEQLFYLFLVEDFFVGIWTDVNDESESTMKVSKSSDFLMSFLNTYSIEDLY